jgi:hypothetical protein
MTQATGNSLRLPVNLLQSQGGRRLSWLCFAIARTGSPELHEAANVMGE